MISIYCQIFIEMSREKSCVNCFVHYYSTCHKTTRKLCVLNNNDRATHILNKVLGKVLITTE